jgi:hypothetical protein
VSTPDQQADPLTIAYMAMGAQEVLNRHPEIAHHYDGGELELIGDVIRFAVQAEELAQQNPGVEGAFELEVAKPLGQYIAERILVRERDLDGSVLRQAANLVERCCSQDQEMDR